jgi:hypothetical protein
VAYVWFAWAAQPTYEITNWLGYVVSAAFAVPPVALVLMSVIVQCCRRRMAVSIQEA